MLQDVLHGCLELVIANLAISVKVNRSDDLVPDLLAFLRHMATTEHLHQLDLRNCTVSVYVHHVECTAQVRLGKKKALLICCCNELGIVNLAITVQVASFHHVCDIWLFHVEDLRQVVIASLKLIKGDKAIIIGIKAQEHLSAFAQLLSLNLQVGDDRTDTRLERGCLSVAHQVCTYVKLAPIRHATRCILLEPLELEKVGHGWTLRWYLFETRLNDLSGFLGGAG